MRDMLTAALKDAVKAKDTRRISTIRLTLAAIKDRDIANRGAGKDPVSDEEILQILLKMIKQREESARIYEEAARVELAEQEREEMDVIRSFLPAQLSDEAVQTACRRVVEETGAQGLRDMGKCMNTLKTRFSGQMDFSKASGMVKDMLKH
ncbi:GatB/YqeY domain-containing protein [Hoeflea sp. CAU 1731]